MPSTRLPLRAANYREITQGTVFCGARAARYEHCDVKGLVITARCDVAQRKYPILNYLPIVPLPDWLRRDGLDILIETELKRQSGTLHRLLRNKHISIALASSIPLDQIARTHFSTNLGTSADKKVAQTFHAHISLREEFNTVIKGDPDSTYTWFCENRPSEVRDIIQRLSRHSVLGHYFLEKLSLDISHSHGYVCLLREVSTLPRAIAERLARGLSAEACRALGGDAYLLNLSFEYQDLAMPIIELGSPTIEHVLQSFSNLFGRIGVPEPIADDIAMIICLNIPDQRNSP